MANQKIIAHNLMPKGKPVFVGMGLEKACLLVEQSPVNPALLNSLNGQFAFFHPFRDSSGKELLAMVRSAGVPMRYLAKVGRDGNLHVYVSSRIDSIVGAVKKDARKGGVLAEAEWDWSHTRMVGAQEASLLSIAPDGAYPVEIRYSFSYHYDEPKTADVEALGKKYCHAILEATEAYLRGIGPEETILVPNSGGADSGLVLVLIALAAKRLGRELSTIKPVTLKIGDGGTDLKQAIGLAGALEAAGFGGIELGIVEMKDGEIASEKEVIRLQEDYKTEHDVRCGMVLIPMARKLREKFPNATHVITGDGGDEAWHDYPLAENKLTVAKIIAHPEVFVFGDPDLRHWANPSFGQGLTRRATLAAPWEMNGFDKFAPIEVPKVISLALEAPDRAVIITSESDAKNLKVRVSNAALVEANRIAAGLGLGRIDIVFPEKKRFQDGAASKTSREGLMGVSSDETRRALHREFIDKLMREG